MDITLALGGGGIRGVAHLGVIQALEKKGFQVKAVAGTSAGGVVAAVYAAGWSPGEIIEEFTKVDQDRLFSFRANQQLLGSRTLLGNEHIRKMLGTFIQRETFRDLHIPCALTAVDMTSLEEVILQEGPVIDAVLATIAIPGVFPPQARGNSYLVDGGVLDPVPVAAARSLAPELPVVVVSISPPPERWQKMRTMDKVIDTPMLSALSNLGVGQAINFSVRSIEIMSHRLAEAQLQAEQPAAVIQPDVADIGMLDKVDVAETVGRGEQAVREARAALDKIQGDH